MLLGQIPCVFSFLKWQLSLLFKTFLTVIHCDWSCYSNVVGFLSLNLWSYCCQTVIWAIWALAGVGVTYHAYWIWYFNWDWSCFRYFVVDHKKKSPRATANVDFLEWWALLHRGSSSFKENEDYNTTSVIQCRLSCGRHFLVCLFYGMLISGILDYLEGFQDTHLHQVYIYSWILGTQIFALNAFAWISMFFMNFDLASDHLSSIPAVFKFDLFLPFSLAFSHFLLDQKKNDSSVFINVMILSYRFTGYFVVSPWLPEGAGGLRVVFLLQMIYL